MYPIFVLFHLVGERLSVKKLGLLKIHKGPLYIMSRLIIDEDCINWDVCERQCASNDCDIHWVLILCNSEPHNGNGGALDTSNDHSAVCDAPSGTVYSKMPAHPWKPKKRFEKRV